MGDEHRLPAATARDPAKGTPLWGEPPLVNVGELDVNSWCVDADAFYGVQDRRPFRPVAEGQRRIMGTAVGGAGGFVADSAGRRLRLWSPTRRRRRPRRFQFRWLAAALQWEGWFPPEGESGRGYPVVCCDAKTGRLVQRLNFPSRSVVVRSS